MPRAAAPSDVDGAMRHGVGDPRASVARVRAPGPGVALGVLDALARTSGDPRDRASPGLCGAAAPEAAG